MNKDNRPKVGVAVIVIKDNGVLIGKRMGDHGTDLWGFPGGHLEYGESPEECASRELMEETGAVLLNARIVPIFTNDVFHEKAKHYITLWVIGSCIGDPVVMEPDKCSGWEWHAWDNLPEPLFLPIENLKNSQFELNIQSQHVKSLT